MDASDKTIEFTLKEFVPVERKIDLIGLTILESYIDGILNPMLLDILFKVNMILIYTENNITSDLKSNKFILYDTLVSEGAIDNFIDELEEAFPDELESMLTYLENWVAEYREYLNSLAGVVSSFQDYLDGVISKLTNNLDVIKEIDLEKLGQIIPLAKSFGIDLEQVSNEELAETEKNEAL